MIKITRTHVYGWEEALRGMRNPYDSWERSDSLIGKDIVNIGDTDKELALKLIRGGAVHSKFMRMITVTMDVKAPFYWWKEADTYRIGTVVNSCSTMHKIHAKELTMEDFSTEHLCDLSKRILMLTIDEINKNRDKFIESGKKNKEAWWQMIQLLPTSYNQLRTVQMNYEVLRNIYRWRKDHKLDEWHTFCDWIKSLPYSELITEGIDNADT